MPLPKLRSMSLPPHVSVRLQQIFLLPWWEHVSNKFSLNPGTQKGGELQIHHGLLMKTLSLAVHSDTWKSLPCRVLCFFSQTSDLASLWQPLRSIKYGQPLFQLFTYTAMRIQRCCSPWIHWLSWSWLQKLQLAHTAGTKARSQWSPTSSLSTNIKTQKFFFYYIPGTFDLECIPFLRLRPSFFPQLCGRLVDPHVALMQLLTSYSHHDVGFGSFRMVISS